MGWFVFGAVCVNTAKHGVACDQLEPCKKWHRHPQILFGVFKSVGGQFLESRTDTHRLPTQVYIYIYISAYPSILKNSKNPFVVYNRDCQKHENVKEPARDLSVLSENRWFFKVFFLGGNYRNQSNGSLVWIFLEEHESMVVWFWNIWRTNRSLRFVRNAKNPLNNWFKHPPTV